MGHWKGLGIAVHTYVIITPTHGFNSNNNINNDTDHDEDVGNSIDDYNVSDNQKAEYWNDMDTNLTLLQAR